MRGLCADEIRHVRESVMPERQLDCSTFRALALTYCPALCDMADELLRVRLAGRSARVRYSVFSDPGGRCGVQGSDGFRVEVGCMASSEKLVERLNSSWAG